LIGAASAIAKSFSAFNPAGIRQAKLGKHHPDLVLGIIQAKYNASGIVDEKPQWPSSSDSSGRSSVGIG
jgi:hypothetical protein